LNTLSGQPSGAYFIFFFEFSGLEKIGSGRPVRHAGCSIDPGTPGQGVDHQWEYREFDMAERMTLDLTGVVSPMDLLKCNACLTAMAPGEILEVILADAEVVDNLTMIVLRSNDEILYCQHHLDRICVGIRKGPRQYDENPL
jgi:TusA-related sulfurtransferase